MHATMRPSSEPHTYKALLHQSREALKYGFFPAKSAKAIHRCPSLAGVSYLNIRTRSGLDFQATLDLSLVLLGARVVAYQLMTPIS